jgi:hypothetical protein
LLEVRSGIDDRLFGSGQELGECWDRHDEVCVVDLSSNKDQAKRVEESTAPHNEEAEDKPAVEAIG